MPPIAKRDGYDGYRVVHKVTERDGALGSGFREVAERGDDAAVLLLQAR